MILETALVDLNLFFSLISGAPKPSPEDPAAASPEPPSDRRQASSGADDKHLRAEDADEAGPGSGRGSAGNVMSLTSHLPQFALCNPGILGQGKGRENAFF